MEELCLTNIHRRKTYTLSKFQSYLLYFFILSILGWLLETVYGYIVLGHFTKRGFFTGPICPIYGVGGLIFIKLLEKYNSNRNSSPIKLFADSIFIFTCLEYGIGYGLECLYHIKLWDYSSEFLNINGRVCLFYSVAWGVIALVFQYLLFPIIKKLTSKVKNKVNNRFAIIFAYLLAVVFLADATYTYISYGVGKIPYLF